MADPAHADPVPSSPNPVAPSPAAPSPRAGTFSLNPLDFSPTNAVRVSGTRESTSSVRVFTTGNPGSPACTAAAAPPSTEWSCTIALPNGAGHEVSAEQVDAEGTVTDEASDMVDVLGAPTIDGAAGFVTSGLISGSGFPGSEVHASVNGAGNGECVSVVAASGYWSCSLTLPSGSWVIQAKQRNTTIGAGAYSSLSGSLDVVVDKDAPGAPAITSPRAGARLTTSTVRYSGTAEAGATVGLYIDNVPSCSTIADGAGRWSCVVSGTAKGEHGIVVIQHDAAGNYGAPSSPIRIVIAPAASAAPPPPAPPPGTPAPTPTPDPSTPAPSPDPPTVPSPPGGAAGSNWGTPTGFGASLPTPAESVENGNWWFAPLVAAAFLVLVAVPLRLAATALRGRVVLPRARLLGRNRAPVTVSSPPEEPRPINAWLAGAVPLAAAAVFIVLAGGVNDELRYLRLTAAVGLALVLLNAVGVALAGWSVARAFGLSGRLRFLPILLLAAALAAFLSRLTGMDPPMLAGVLIGLGIPLTVPARSAAMTRMAEILGVVILAVAAWLARAPLGSVEGFWASLFSELLAAVALAGLGSALVLVLPLGRLPGAAVLRWSKAAWAGLVLAVGFLAGGILLGGGTDARFPVLGSLVVAAAVAAISVAIWSWTRYVEPATR